MKINTLIVYDDPSWRLILTEYVAPMPMLTKLGLATRFTGLKPYLSSYQL